MGEWYRVIKTIKGNKYVYMQRTHRVPGRRSPVTESYSLGRVDGGGRKKTSRLRRAAMAVFGLEDDYGQRVDSLWNRYINKEKGKADPQKTASKTGKPAEAGKSESGFLVGGNGETPTATGSQSSSDPSGTTGSPTDED